MICDLVVMLPVSDLFKPPASRCAWILAGDKTMTDDLVMAMALPVMLNAY
jgi:hypothetical protein